MPYTYVGQLPEHVAEDDIKNLFPKDSKFELFSAKANNKGIRSGFAFVTFADDNSAAATAIKPGPSLTLENTQLKVAYQTKRPMAPLNNKTIEIPKKLSFCVLPLCFLDIGCLYFVVVKYYMVLSVRFYLPLVMVNSHVDINVFCVLCLFKHLLAVPFLSYLLY